MVTTGVFPLATPLVQHRVTLIKNISTRSRGFCTSFLLLRHEMTAFSRTRECITLKWWVVVQILISRLSGGVGKYFGRGLPGRHQCPGPTMQHNAIYKIIKSTSFARNLTLDNWKYWISTFFICPIMFTR